MNRPTFLFLIASLLLSAPLYALYPKITFAPAIPRTGDLVTAMVEVNGCRPPSKLTASFHGSTLRLDEEGPSGNCSNQLNYFVTTTFVAPQEGRYTAEFRLLGGQRGVAAERTLVVAGASSCSFQNSLYAEERHSAGSAVFNPVRLHWCAAGNATYRVYASVAGGAFAMIAALPVGATSYTAQTSATGTHAYFIEATSTPTERTVIERVIVSAPGCLDTPTSICLAGRFECGSSAAPPPRPAGRAPCA